LGCAGSLRLVIFKGSMGNYIGQYLRLCLICGLGFSTTAYSQSIGFDIVGERSSIEIPFESFNNLIVVPVVLNHRIPLKFVLDTGVRTSILTDRTFSDLLNISYNREIPLTGADMERQVIAHVANGISLKLPGVVGSGQALLVLEEDYLQLRNYLGADVHGILGYELFSRFIVKINYQTNIITLYEPYSFKPKRSYKSLAISIEDTKPYIETSLTMLDGTDIKAKLMLDTGASHSLLLDYNSSEAMNLPEKKLRSNLGRGLGGSIDGYIGRVASVRVGKYEFEGPIASFPDAGNFDQIFARTGRLGTMGGGIFSRFNVIFDYFNGYFYFSKSTNFNQKFDYNMSGLEIRASGLKLNEFMVEQIRKESPAEEIGFQIGDKLLRINGNYCDRMKLGEINNFFRRKHNKKMTVIVDRDGEIIKKKFRLRRMI
ncbi:MAG: aspartyl protease family protein, partial [Cyclobacteriaceae bacterium]